MIKITIIVIVSIISAALFWAYKFFGPEGEVDKKTNYAEMQGVELYYRDKNLVTPFILVTTRGLHIVGLKTDNSKFPYLWLELRLEDANDADGILKTGNERPLNLTCLQVQAILANEKASPKAILFLNKNCTP